MLFAFFSRWYGQSCPPYSSKVRRLGTRASARWWSPCKLFIDWSCWILIRYFWAIFSRISYICWFWSSCRRRFVNLSFYSYFYMILIHISSVINIIFPRLQLMGLNTTIHRREQMQWVGTWTGSTPSKLFHNVTEYLLKQQGVLRLIVLQFFDPWDVYFTNHNHRTYRGGGGGTLQKYATWCWGGWVLQGEIHKSIFGTFE